jgi:hypothetical protein
LTKYLFILKGKLLYCHPPPGIAEKDFNPPLSDEKNNEQQLTKPVGTQISIKRVVTKNGAFLQLNNNLF